MKHSELTAREQTVCELLTTGLTAKEAGRVLGISNRTVETHKDSIFRKFGVDNVVQLTRIVLQREWTEKANG